MAACPLEGLVGRPPTQMWTLDITDGSPTILKTKMTINSSIIPTADKQIERSNSVHCKFAALAGQKRYPLNNPSLPGPSLAGSMIESSRHQEYIPGDLWSSYISHSALFTLTEM